MERALKILCNKKITYILLFLFCLFLSLNCGNYDYDLYARLIVGENFFEKGVFNYTDYLSYTPTHPWFDHEYGASLVFYLFYKFFGNFGFILIHSLLMFFTGFFVIKTQQLQKHAYPVSIFFMAIFYILFFNQNHTLVRCHLFSFLLFSIFLYILEKTRKFNSKLIWLLPILIILWNNLHGGVVAGLGLLGMYFAGELLSKKPFKKYLLAMLISLPLLIINPYGVSYLKFLFSANTMTRKYIIEWWSVFSSMNFKKHYPIFVLSVFANLLNIFKSFRAKKFDITKFIILVVTLYLGTFHIKLLPLTLISISAFCFNDIIGLFRKKSFRFFEFSTRILILIALILIPAKHPSEARTSVTKFPVQEVEFIRTNNLKGNLLTEFGFGSYASYKLYPDNLIYMDGRYEEVYNEKEFNNLKNFSLADAGWENVFTEYPTDIIMIMKNLPVYSEKLGKSEQWIKVYEGNVCGVFVKKENAKKSYIIPSDDIEYYRKNEFTNKGHFGKVKDNEDDK